MAFSCRTAPPCDRITSLRFARTSRSERAVTAETLKLPTISSTVILPFASIISRTFWRRSSANMGSGGRLSLKFCFTTPV